jgi:hypothetical protein
VYLRGEHSLDLGSMGQANSSSGYTHTLFKEAKNDINLYKYKFDIDAHKLECVLNNMPMHVRKLLNKATLDTIFRYWLYYRYPDESFLRLVNNKDSLQLKLQNKIDELTIKNQKDTINSNEKFNIRRLNVFKKYAIFLDTNFGKPNFFVYDLYFRSVIINSEFKDSTSENVYYKINSSEERLFNIEFYKFKE